MHPENGFRRGYHGFTTGHRFTHGEHIRHGKPGFRTARMTEFPVIAHQDNPGDFAISPELAGTDSGVEEIVITAERKIPVADRANVDEFINTMDTAEIGKFAASDISEAIKRIPGVNVVEGQFAIIRGLEDRYSSTLYNSAPVPSPDPIPRAASVSAGFQCKCGSATRLLQR